MTKEQLVKALRYCSAVGMCDDCWLKTIQKEFGAPFCDDKLKQEAADLIEQQAARIAELEAKVPRWIPVEERLPEVHSLWGEWNAMMSVLNSIGGYDRLRELAEADKEGRIVILPAKTVYELVVDAGPSCDMKCPPAFMDDDGVPCCDFCDKGEIIVNERNCRQDDVRQIGNTVWLTREEAEAALEVRNGNR